jgi:hypothetical protein
VAVTDRRTLIIALSVSGEPKQLVFSARRGTAQARSIKRVSVFNQALRVKMEAITLTLDPRIWRMGEIAVILQALAPSTHQRPPR